MPTFPITFTRGIVILVIQVCLIPAASAQVKTKTDSAKYYYDLERKWQTGDPRYENRKVLSDSGYAICVIDNKIYRSNSPEFISLKNSLELLSAIYDETSTTGFHYILFYRRKNKTL